MGHNQPQGLFSNVFTFVSRELESFVVNATGATPQQDSGGANPSNLRISQPVQSRVSSEAKQSQREPSSCRNRVSENRRERNRERKQIDADVIPPKPPRPTSLSKPKNITQGAKTKRAIDHFLSEHEDEELSGSDRSSRSPTPVPLPQALRRRLSVTMPGSLFPRSPSVEPDSNASLSDEEGRHVRFAPGVVNPPVRSKEKYAAATLEQPRDDLEPGPSSRPRHVPHTEPSDPPSSPLCPRAIPSVREAINRFKAGPEEADPSMLLPKSSPKGKGKEREPGNRNLVPSSVSHNRKEQQLSSVEIIEADTSGEIRVRGKERELVAAREEQQQHERRWERDKNNQEAEEERKKDKDRIKMLEDEVKRLKEELSKRCMVRPSPDPHSLMPAPPPPPPPLPPPLPVRISTTQLGSISDAGSMFLSARAALRQAGPPVEAPINSASLGRAKRQGQPTVNLSSDKMAAFLIEMKTVRLRKVSDSGVPPELSSLERRASTGGSGINKPASQDLLRRSLNSRKEVGTVTGGKRKIDAVAGSELQDALRVAVKRRSMGSSDSGSLASTSSGAGNSDMRISRIPFPSSMLFSQSYHPPAQPPGSIRTWPSVSTTETDITTPSLCSDNDADREGEASLDDRLPSTPPGTPSTAIGLQAEDISTASGSQTDPIDVDMERERTTLSPERAITPLPTSPQLQHAQELFEKRPPTSPMPAPTPRKPRPPARALRAVKYRPQERDYDDDDDPLSLTFSSPEDASVIRQRSKSKEKKKVRPKNLRHPGGNSSRDVSQSSITLIKRQPTLEEELCDAYTRSMEDDDVDDDVLVGVGTRSKREGFLAHGGAGGPPVFMGVGYVRGAENASEEEEYRSRRSNHHSSIPIAAKRKNKR